MLQRHMPRWVQRIKIISVDWIVYQVRRRGRGGCLQQVSTTVTIEDIVVWDVKPCNAVEIH